MSSYYDRRFGNYPVLLAPAESRSTLPRRGYLQEQEEVHKMMSQIVVTRHPALVKYLVETGLIKPGAMVIEHASADQVRGKHVIGVLPLHLAVEAASVTEVPMDLPPDARGRELSIEEVRQYAGAPVRYVVSPWCEKCQGTGRVSTGPAWGDIVPCPDC